MATIKQLLPSRHNGDPIFKSKPKENVWGKIKNIFGLGNQHNKREKELRGNQNTNFNCQISDIMKSNLNSKIEDRQINKKQEQGLSEQKNELTKVKEHSKNMKKFCKSDFKCFKIKSQQPPKYLICNDQSFKYNTLPKDDKVVKMNETVCYKLENIPSNQNTRKLSDNYLSTAWSQQTLNEEIKYESEGNKPTICNECEICDLYMESKGMFKKVDLQYPWIDIISFKAPISNIHLQNCDIIKKCRCDEINFEIINTKLGDNFKIIKNKLSERQPFILINKKTVKDSENNRNNKKKLSSRTMIYLHGNGEDIGNVLGHCIDLSTQLKCNVLIPELSGFGAYNKGLRNVTNKNTLLNKWVNDINNALLVAKDQTNSDNYEDIIIYSKGMSSSIVLELLKFNQLKNIVFEDITSDIDTMNKYFKLKSMKLSKSCYSQMKNNYILNSLNCIKNINFLKKPVCRSNSNYEKDDHLNLSVNKQSIDSVSDWDCDKILAPSFSVPRILFISKDSLHQRVMTNDVICTMLSKIYNVENCKPNVRIEKVLNEFKNSFSKNAQGVNEQNYSGCIKHMIFRESDSMDFKKQHRSQFLDALNWISY